MEPKCSLPHSQCPLPAPILSQLDPVHVLHPTSWKSILILSSKAWFVTTEGKLQGQKPLTTTILNNPLQDFKGWRGSGKQKIRHREVRRLITLSCFGFDDGYISEGERGPSLSRKRGDSRVPQRETLLIPVSVRCTLRVAANARGKCDYSIYSLLG